MSCLRNQGRRRPVRIGAANACSILGTAHLQVGLKPRLPRPKRPPVVAERQDGPQAPPPRLKQHPVQRLQEGWVGGTRAAQGGEGASKGSRSQPGRQASAPRWGAAPTPQRVAPQQAQHGLQPEK